VAALAVAVIAAVMVVIHQRPDSAGAQSISAATTGAQHRGPAYAPRVRLPFEHVTIPAL
jgi:hypothetical protein